MKNLFKSGNIFIVLAYRILLMIFIFTLCRIGFYVFNFRMFPDIGFKEMMTIMGGGLLFDISAILYINLILILVHVIPLEVRYDQLYQNILKYLFFIINGLAIAAYCADFIYYRFVLTRATTDIFQTFEHEQNLVELFFKFQVDYWQVVLFGLLLIFIMILLYNQVKVMRPSPGSKPAYSVANIILIPVIAALVILGIRGEYRYSAHPISIGDAARYVENPRDAAIVLNTPFSLIRTIGKKTLVKYEFFESDKLAGIYNPHYVPVDTAVFKKENVVIFILESFAREYIGDLNKDLDNGMYKGYAPFLDSLLKYSLTFDVSIANGKKSIEAVSSILASIPSLETPYSISPYGKNTINGLAGLLKKEGYYSAFFHGAPNGSMGFDSFSKMAGFDDYFGLDQYPDKKDFDGIWGVWDEPFFRFVAGKLNEFREPFLASVFSISSHHPFEVPEKYKGRFAKGPAPILEVVGYTDFALREFFKEAGSQPWFKNTLFVITADHANESIHKEFQNNFGSYSVPVIFYKPGSDLKGVKAKVVQQIDIMPSILSYLNFGDEYIAFGNNVFDDSTESFAFNTSGCIYNLYMKDHLLEMTDNIPVGFYNYKNDRLLENNLVGKKPELMSVMEKKLKAVIQTYNSRLIDNNMVVTK